jgi:hypothetical protein
MKIGALLVAVFALVVSAASPALLIVGGVLVAVLTCAAIAGLVLLEGRPPALHVWVIAYGYDGLQAPAAGRSR